VVPLIMGIALHFNINPYHLGIVFLLNLEIGYLMPPMGLNLFIAGFRFNRPVPDLYRVVLPFIGVFVVALLITTYVPSLTVGSTTEVVAPPPSRAPPPTPTASGSASVVPLVPTDCDEQRDGESFEEFDKRCNITGKYPAPSAAPSPPSSAASPPSSSDCEEPRSDESFEAFDKRCGITGGKP
jgi:hypothetical protein